jgi:hypothetical protein
MELWIPKAGEVTVVLYTGNENSFVNVRMARAALWCSVGKLAVVINAGLDFTLLSSG